MIEKDTAERRTILRSFDETLGLRLTRNRRGARLVQAFPLRYGEGTRGSITKKSSHARSSQQIRDEKSGYLEDRKIRLQFIISNTDSILIPFFELVSEEFVKKFFSQGISHQG